MPEPMRPRYSTPTVAWWIGAIGFLLAPGWIAAVVFGGLSGTNGGILLASAGVLAVIGHFLLMIARTTTNRAAVHAVGAGVALLCIGLLAGGVLAIPIGGVDLFMTALLVVPRIVPLGLVAAWFIARGLRGRPWWAVAGYGAYLALLALLTVVDALVQADLYGLLLLEMLVGGLLGPVVVVHVAEKFRVTSPVRAIR